MEHNIKYPKLIISLDRIWTRKRVWSTAYTIFVQFLGVVDQQLIGVKEGNNPVQMSKEKSGLATPA